MAPAPRFQGKEVQKTKVKHKSEELILFVLRVTKIRTSKKDASQHKFLHQAEAFNECDTDQ